MIIKLIGVLVVLILGLFLLRNIVYPYFFVPRNSVNQGGSIPSITPFPSPNITTVAQNLTIPWETAFLPNGDLLVTERAGKLLKIGSETKLISEIEGVLHFGEGGLLGMALHPNFSINHFIYLYSTTQNTTGITNRVERYTLINDALSERAIIIEGIKGSANHNGGRITFGPDGYLYITSGDADNPNSAQDKNSLNGKILRLIDDGGTPSDNPFGNAVYSLGHRNPQGLSWDKVGNLWATEHGPSGSQTGYDELNIITKGGNYGWPIISGSQTREGLISPIIQSGTEDTWAPSGMTFWDGSLFFSGLRGEALYEAKIISGNQVELITHLKQEYGRFRSVNLGPDNSLYVSTNNKDGRGEVNPGDDKIIKINPQIFR